MSYGELGWRYNVIKPNTAPGGHLLQLATSCLGETGENQALATREISPDQAGMLALATCLQAAPSHPEHRDPFAAFRAVNVVPRNITVTGEGP